MLANPETPDRSARRLAKGIPMKPMTIAGLVLIVLGIAGLASGRFFSFTGNKQVVSMGPLTASVTEQRHVDVPDIAGVGAVVAGVLLVFFSRRTA